MSYEYKIKESKEDPRESVIEKSGITSEFTVHQIEASIKQNAKTVKELTAMEQIESAKVTNVETNHPFVKEMTEADRFAVHMYHEAEVKLRVIREKLAEFKKENDFDVTELEEIEKQTGIKTSPVTINPEDLKTNGEESTNENK